MQKIYEFPNVSNVVRTEVFRYGDLAIFADVPVATYDDAKRAAELSGDPVEAILSRYARRLADDYHSDGVRARRGPHR